MQPIESALAEEWIAVALQPDSDFRMDHHADLILLHSQAFDAKKLGLELLRIMRHRSIGKEELTSGIITRFRGVQVIRRSMEWEKIKAARPNMRPFSLADIWLSIAKTYRECVLNSLSNASAQAQGNYANLGRMRTGEIGRAVDVDPSTDNVIPFRAPGRG
jgi:hypothetical protein